MAEKVKISSLAQKDLEDSSEWYEGENPGLGDRFAKVIYSAIISISKNAVAYPLRKANIREFIVKKFPYVIVYQFIPEKNLVKILRIFHTSRNPKFKYKRK
ncbi:MAG TPA: type II toxin-antitoxin system RelE/ParE family toxin [Mucilaginibacter sp.]|jgi:plasmid stabilization system protein ParE